MRTIAAVALLLALALAGCASDDPSDDTGSTGSSSSSSNTGSSSGNPPTGDAPTRFVNVTANQSSGDVPIAIGFDVDLVQENVIANESFYDSYDGNFSYIAFFQDGNETSGEDAGSYLFLEHTYQVGGIYNVLVTVTFEDGSTVDGNVTLSLTTPEPPRQLPAETEFEFGESLGCVGDFATCIGIELVTKAGLAPADATGIDGFWLPLTEEYWGLKLISTAGNVLGDSDCSFYDEAFGVTGEANAGGGPCEGTVPNGSAWIYIYSYAEPSTGQTLSFSLP
ncbi:MAG: hypothetical protein ACPHK8_07810 [Thermoplasmatota archaeon]